MLDKLVQMLVFGCAYQRIPDQTCSSATPGRRRDEWIEDDFQARDVEHTTAWSNAHKKFVWCIERRVVIGSFWIAFSVVLSGGLVREGWMRDRWSRRPRRRPLRQARWCKL